jgi:hypothetical protein
MMTAKLNRGMGLEVLVRAGVEGACITDGRTAVAGGCDATGT